jgi:hypothetical protein
LVGNEHDTTSTLAMLVGEIAPFLSTPVLTTWSSGVAGRSPATTASI